VKPFVFKWYKGLHKRKMNKISLNTLTKSANYSKAVNFIKNPRVVFTA